MTDDMYVIQEKMVDVGDGHTLYVQDWGNKEAKVPIVFLHGGPGSQVKDKHKAVFDPLKHRVIFFDQRGCGRSTPYGSLENNTTQKLIADITLIADQLLVDKFTIHGSSWGSTLALAYAIENPTRVANVVVGGVFTGSQAETDWIDQGHFTSFYPDVWDAYLQRTPKQHREVPSAYHFDKILNGTPEEQKLSGYAYGCLEAGVMKLDDRFTPEDFDTYDASGTRIEVHYLANGCFMPDRHIINNIHTLTMPIYIVQGRYDMVCPPTTAYEIHKKAAQSTLYWTLSGHYTEHEGQNILRSIIAHL